MAKMMVLPCVQDEIEAIERNSEEMREAFKDLEGRMSKVSQTATRIGDRLQVGLASCLTPTIRCLQW